MGCATEGSPILVKPCAFVNHIITGFEPNKLPVSYIPKALTLQMKRLQYESVHSLFLFSKLIMHEVNV